MLGSSPLARGLPADRRAASIQPRIIPARAGFTRPEVLLGPVPADHPRSRGVYPGGRGPWPWTRGSSPLARGLLPMMMARRFHSRIIPARAGFTGHRHPRRGRQGDHPRSRGVYRIPMAPRSPCGGSSPLARGLPRLLHWSRLTRRIIPARAGFTSPPISSPRMIRDHPRSRGVYFSDLGYVCYF